MPIPFSTFLTRCCTSATLNTPCCTFYTRPPRIEPLLRILSSSLLDFVSLPLTWIGRVQDVQPRATTLFSFVSLSCSLFLITFSNLPSYSVCTRVTDTLYKLKKRGFGSSSNIHIRWRRLRRAYCCLWFLNLIQQAFVKRCWSNTHWLCSRYCAIVRTRWWVVGTHTLH